MVEFLSASTWLAYLIRIASFYLIAWLIHRTAPWLSRHMVGWDWFKASEHRLSYERRRTLRGLIASAISFVALITATLFAVGQFVDQTTLIWMVGLFSAAFGLGARPLVSDFLTGVSLIFEDTFTVGEKVEIMGAEGMVEEVNLRTTVMRAPGGEVFTVPNGEIRVVRNFSRGRFSTANVTLKISTAEIPRALAILEPLGTEAVAELPNLLAPWQIISQEGVVGKHTELTLLAQARFGKAAEMRPRLQALVQQRLENAGISLEDQAWLGHCRVSRIVQLAYFAT